MDALIYKARRQRLAQNLGRGVVVLATAPEVRRNGDSDYAYRFGSHFHYMTGFAEPEAVWVMVLGDQPRDILFCRERNEEREIWEGFRHGPERAREAFGFDEAFPIGDLDGQMTKLLANQPVLHFPLGADGAWDTRLTGWLNAVRAQVRSGVSAPTEVSDVRLALDRMRLFKDDHELSLMRRAAAISAQAHQRAMATTCPGWFEYQVEAELLHEFRRSGAAAPAYPSIVASGANACVLHYVENDGVLRGDDLLLIDAGCEYQGYAADITRTFPVNGRFAGPGKDLYELVLSSQEAAIAQVRVGHAWDAAHDAAVRVLVQGFVDLGLCQGSVEGVLESGDYKRFYMHKTSHWLGMDVHDVGSYREGEGPILLQPGMVLTVEPGCYVRPAEKVPEAFWNIGIRIEDDVLVTESGHEVLTEAAPKSIRDIESVMAAPDRGGKSVK